MAKTPFNKLGSQDILSAHLNGLQFSINNVEDALNLSATAITAHPLAPVIDMDDPTTRYRIYEGDIRSWLTAPAPVIKRNGVAVNASEYVIQPAYGVVVFNVQQSTLAVITADVTHVSNVSTRLNAIEVETAKVAGIDTRTATAQGEVDAVEGRVGTLETNATALTGRVTTLESGGSGGALTVQPLDPNTVYITTVKRGSNLALQEQITNIPMGAKTIDAFPMWVEHDVEVDAIRTVTGATNVTASTMICGIYSNKNIAPDDLLAETNAFTATTPGEYNTPLKAPIVLKRGLYWIARWHSGGIKLDGYLSKNTFDNKVHINSIVEPSDATVVNKSGNYNVISGVRWTDTTATVLTTLATLPSGLPANKFPAIGAGTTGTKYLGRDQIGLQWARVKRAF